MAVLKPAVVLFLRCCSTISCDTVAGGIRHESHSKTNGQVEVGVVLVERLRPNCHVKVASGVLFERS